MIIMVYLELCVHAYLGYRMLVRSEVVSVSWVGMSQGSFLAFSGRILELDSLHTSLQLVIWLSFCLFTPQWSFLCTYLSIIRETLPLAYQIRHICENRPQMYAKLTTSVWTKNCKSVIDKFGCFFINLRKVLCVCGILYIWGFNKHGFATELLSRFLPKRVRCQCLSSQWNIVVAFSLFGEGLKCHWCVPIRQ